MFVSIYSETLWESTSQHLLLLVGFDTLIYRKYYDRPPILVGHQDYFLAPLPGSEALLKSGTGKGNIYCKCCFISVYCSISLWRCFRSIPFSELELLPLPGRSAPERVATSNPSHVACLWLRWPDLHRQLPSPPPVLSSLRPRDDPQV